MTDFLDSNKRIRLGIWGLGRGSHFTKIAESLHIDVVAGCDINPIMREKFSKECPSAFVTADENEFLNFKDMDAVLIATFFTSHAEHTIRALNAGFHVMCEVTSFFTPAEGVRVVEAVKRSGKVYNLLENYPFSKENMFLADLWQKGFFGEFQYGEIDYIHECRMLAYGYNVRGYPPVEPGYTAHSWRSWLNFHYYNTHSLGPLMKITGLRPERITALKNKVSLPGYLPGSRMGTACVSLIEMSNGGIFRNAMGATTSDSHTGKRLWGTRAAAESDGENLQIRVGAAGNGAQVAVKPEWPMLGELADRAGHGGGDFWELYYFARQVLTGEPAPWDIYAACDVTLAGIMAVRSEEAGGIPMQIPDFRDEAVRESYRNDHGKQEHFDPAKIYPEDGDMTKTVRFAGLMVDLTRDTALLRRAVDGFALRQCLADDSGRFKVLYALDQLWERLPELYIHRKEAENLIALYPNASASSPLREMLKLEEPELALSEDEFRKTILGLRAEMLK